MSNQSFVIQAELLPILRAGNVEECIQRLRSRLEALSRTPFHAILDLRITTDPAETAAVFDGFFEEQSEQFEIQAAYTEMNGFDINTSLWFCDLFAFETYGGHDDYDWLSDWQSGDSPSITVEGLEPLQEIYASEAFGDPRFEEAETVTTLLVVLLFQDLIRRSALHMTRLKFPILATAHGYDFIYETGAKPA